MKKGNDIRVSLPRSKCILLFLLITANGPSNFTCYCRSQPNQSFPLANHEYRYSSENTNMSRFNIATSSDDTQYALVTKLNLSFTIASFIISIIILVFILAYLNSVSFAKECVLLYLYKDVVKVWISLNCVWVMAIILCYSTKNGLDNNTFIATAISFFFCALFVMLYVFMIAISALNLYTTKTKMLDPPMPWGIDEKSGINTIRLISVFVGLGGMSIIYGLGFYPKVQYLLIRGKYSESLTFPRTTLILPSFYAFLLMIYLIITVAAKFYASSERPSMERKIPEQMKYFLWTVLIFSACFHLFATICSINQWRVYVILVSLFLVGTPAIIITSATQLKLFMAKKLKDISHEVFLLNIYLMPTFLLLLMNCSLYIVYKLLDI